MVKSNSNKLIKWKFRIESFGKGYGDNRWRKSTFYGKLFIGLSSKDIRFNQYWAYEVDKPCFNFIIEHKHSREFELELNTSTGQFIKRTAKIEEKRVQTIVKGEDIRYKLAVCLTGENGKLTLTHFEITDIHNDP